ncbi:unnamed protein product [Ixodes pacificus]
MNPAKLSRHLSTKHPAYKDRTTEYFAKKQQQLEAMKLGSHKKDSTSSLSKTKATYLLSYRIAKQLKPYTICEDLIMPCVQDVIKTVIGEEHLKKVQQIPCSNDTVGRRIREMASDVESQVIECAKNSPKFAIAVDESCDVSGYPQLVVFVRYLSDGATVQEEFLCCLKLKTTTTGRDIFDALNEFFCKWRAQLEQVHCYLH